MQFEEKIQIAVDVLVEMVQIRLTVHVLNLKSQNIYNIHIKFMVLFCSQNSFGHFVYVLNRL